MGNYDYKQIIVVRKDLNMSPGKMAAQVAHASMEFLRQELIKNAIKINQEGYHDYINHVWVPGDKDIYYFNSTLNLDKGFYEEWLADGHAKTVLRARNKNKLLKVYDYAKELGFKVNEDFFPVYDHCHTELDPEEEDGTTLTCIGFRPMKNEIINQISKKYQLYTE